MFRRRGSPRPEGPQGLPGLPELDERGRQVRVVLLGRDGCHLCEEARSVVAAVCEQEGAGWLEREVTASAELLDRYAALVPVVFVDGAETARFRVDPVDLRGALRRRRRWSR